MNYPGLTRLAGNRYILEPTGKPSTRIGEMDWILVAGQELGANKLSQWLASTNLASNFQYGFGSADVVLFIVQGAGSINISGREFEFATSSGIYVAPGETFAISRIENGPLQLLVGACPESSAAPQLGGTSMLFDDSVPSRVVPLADQERHATADRFYQLLVNEKLGECRVTQFIGSIPRSKAPEHFHEYEEIIMVLQGTGIFWTEQKSAPIHTGSIIYLPRKQPHCVQCTDEDGMQLVGMFYPAGSPTVRY